MYWRIKGIQLSWHENCRQPILQISSVIEHHNWFIKSSVGKPASIASSSNFLSPIHQAIDVWNEGSYKKDAMCV